MMTLDEMKKKYPLPQEWKIPEVVQHRATIAETDIYLVGIAALKGDSQAVGSAAELEDFPTERAYFELLERVSILQSESSQPDSFPLLSADGNLKGDIPFSAVFPTSTDPKQWQFAKSNGVALGQGFEDASRRARLELIERHRILEHWYTQTPPLKIEMNSGRFDKMSKEFDFELCEFQSLSQNDSKGEFVVGLFGFQRDAAKPFIYGLAAADSKELAITKAEGEFVQRAGFLWEEEVESETVEFSPTPMFHQEYFLSKERSLLVKNWLDGNGKKQTLNLKTPDFQEEGFADITPDFLKGHLVALKAIQPKLLPLTFGKQNPALLDYKEESLLVHPIA